MDGTLVMMSSSALLHHRNNLSFLFWWPWLPTPPCRLAPRISLIIRKQKKSIRIMCFKNSRESAEPLFASKNILSFHKNLQLHAGKFFWKAANSYLCPSLNHLFHMRDDQSTFHVPHRRLDVSQNSITYAGVKTWNAIPPEIRSSTSLNCFKGKYKEFLSPTVS